MNTDEHRFRGPDSGLAKSLRESLFSEGVLAVGKRGSGHSLSGLICVHLWWCGIVAA
jgi:hypothetical protein